jgi:hypothetical protein
MGLEGDQRIDASQNKTLAEHRSNGVEVFLFEVFEAGNYIFRGQVGLIMPIAIGSGISNVKEIVKETCRMTIRANRLSPLPKNKFICMKKNNQLP